MIKTKFIVNPAAGAGKTARKWPLIESFLTSKGQPLDFNLSEAPGHATELAQSAVGQGYQQIVAVGGDGTVNEVVNGIYRAGGAGKVTLGVIATGTGSDYIRSLGIPHDPIEACRCLLEQKAMTVDLGTVEYTRDGVPEKRLFVNFAGLGFDAEVVRRTTRQFKRFGSTASYLLGLLTTLVSYKNKPVSLAIDGEKIEKKVCAVIMNNGKYAGGGMFTAPGADLTDGLLDVMIIGDLTKPDLLWSLPRVYKGTHLTHPRLTFKRARVIEIRSPETIPLQADGELLGETPARFGILPAALNIITCAKRE